MFCENCGAPLSDIARFCAKCGVKVTNASKSLCLECGAEYAEDQTYCEQCGSKLNPPSVPSRPESPESVAVKSVIGGKLKRVHMFVSKPLQSAPLMTAVSLPTGTVCGVGFVDVESSADRMRITCNKLWGSPVLFRRIVGADSVLYSDIQSIRREDKRFVLTLKSGNQLVFATGKPDAVDFFTNIQLLIETGG